MCKSRTRKISGFPASKAPSIMVCGIGRIQDPNHAGLGTLFEQPRGWVLHISLRPDEAIHDDRERDGDAGDLCLHRWRGQSHPEAFGAVSADAGTEPGRRTGDGLTLVHVPGTGVVYV